MAIIVDRVKSVYIDSKVTKFRGLKLYFYRSVGGLKKKITVLYITAAADGPASRSRFEREICVRTILTRSCSCPSSLSQKQQLHIVLDMVHPTPYIQ